MSLAMIIAMLIGSWLAVAAAMLWGVLRITRRHHHPVQPAPAPKTDEASNQHANAH
ncbi:hypothetical protein [Pseudomonas sp. 18173]|uniref:hypothetical protein n=1 Tax=Pseudomonas sp. 18173 TaxID=3390055 RepID=UPI003D209F2D